MYDHTDAEEEYFSIKGFFNGAYFSVSKEERLEMVLTQLEKYYGPQVRNFVGYEEGVWRNESFTYNSYDQHVLPHQNNGHAIFSDTFMKSANLPSIDILVVPSAEHHLDTDLNDQVMLDFVRKVSKDALYVTSHCDGAFVLAQAGLLDEVASTTFPSDIPKYRERFPHLDVRDSVLFVHDGKFITSAGGAKSFEAALYLCEVLYGAEIARTLAGGLVIDWNLTTTPHYLGAPL